MLRTSEWYQQNIGRLRDTAEFQTDRFLIDILEELVVHMEKQGMTRAELAKRLGVSRSFVTQVLKGSPNLTIRTLFRVLWAAGLSLEARTEPRQLALLRRYGMDVANRIVREINEAHVEELQDDVSALAA